MECGGDETNGVGMDYAGIRVRSRSQREVPARRNSRRTDSLWRESERLTAPTLSRSWSMVGMTLLPKLRRSARDRDEAGIIDIHAPCPHQRRALVGQGNQKTKAAPSRTPARSRENCGKS